MESITNLLESIEATPEDIQALKRRLKKENAVLRSELERNGINLKPISIEDLESTGNYEYDRELRKQTAIGNYLISQLYK